VGWNVSKRVEDLRKQVDEAQIGRWRVGRVFILTFLALTLLSFTVFPKTTVSTPQSEEPLDTREIHLQREKELRAYVAASQRWLDRNFFLRMPGSAGQFERYSKGMIATFAAGTPKNGKESSLFEPDEWLQRLSFYSASVTLRIAFVVLAFWPLWILSMIGGYYFTMHRKRKTGRDNILSVLTRGLGPFYSGIYGPLRPNNSISATDLSCPSLACPALAPRPQTLNHSLIKTLKKYGALNETNTQLIQTILAHGDFPSFVGEEIPVQAEEQEQTLGAIEERRSQTGYFEIEDGFTLEHAAIAGLAAVMESHRRIVSYREMLEKKSFTVASLNKNYPAHEANVEKLLKGMPELPTMLIRVLSPNRLWALAGMQPTLVATAYLSLEAGKCLVYRRHGKGFTRISNYPHLQARAVMQSVPHFHKEYDGDARLLVRQAIICSRRHGDFGRAFLPIRMPLESRALRDWLEIMYATKEERETVADLVELDAHIEEISVNWRQGFMQIVQQGASDIEEKTETQQLARGIPFKSVVLFPIDAVVSCSLRGIHKERLKRISELLPKTQKYQAHLSISARLPGFKRQAMEAVREEGSEAEDAVIQVLQKRPDAKEIVEDWRIVRRMLTRYNWLSTRVGDDAVPVAGLLLGLLRVNKPTPLPVLVPLRNRRFTEVFGRQWETKLYKNPINADTVEVYTTQSSLEEALQTRVPKESNAARLSAMGDS
jgi:hypothetical protein